MDFERIGIVGVGLIGGSLGLALKRVFPQVHVLGVGRDPERLEVARSMGAVDDFSTDMASLRDRDLAVLATPVGHILSALETMGDCLAPGAVLTDVGSTKRWICVKAWKRLPQSVEFIGGHPIAGRETAGVESSLATLFEDAPYVLCPRPGTDSPNLERLRSVLEKIGSRVQIMTPKDHDRAIAWVSHVPQLVSTALANLENENDLSIAGSGFRDMTRLAGSPYSIWDGILSSNADNVELVLQRLIAQLERMRSGDLAGLFERANETYRQVSGSRGKVSEKTEPDS